MEFNYVYSRFQTLAVFWMMCSFFWVFPRCLNFMCRSFGSLCLFHLHRWCSCLHNLWRWNRQSVPKRLHIKLRRREITPKTGYKKIRLLYTYSWREFNYIYIYIYIYIYMCVCVCVCVCVCINENWIFTKDFPKILKYQISLKFRPFMIISSN